MERINITLTEDQLRALRQYRAKTGDNISYTIRRLVDQFFRSVSDGHTGAAERKNEDETKDLKALSSVRN